jgi:hypothetical protein
MQNLLCSNFSEKIEVLKECNIPRLYQSTWKSTKTISALRREKMTFQKRDLSHNTMPSENNPVTIHLHCGYHVAHQLAKESQTFI